MNWTCNISLYNALVLVDAYMFWSDLNYICIYVYMFWSDLNYKFNFFLLKNVLNHPYSTFSRKKNSNLQFKITLPNVPRPKFRTAFALPNAPRPAFRTTFALPNAPRPAFRTRVLYKLQLQVQFTRIYIIHH